MTFRNPAGGSGKPRQRDLGGTRLLLALLLGALFAAGLTLAGMTDPAKVIGFLDVGGNWDPSLALVMGAAIAVYMPVYFLVRRRPRPHMGERFAIPAETPIDARLVGGAALFGAGWGLAGFCPGPALAGVATTSIGFVVGMMAALVAYEAVRRLARQA